MFHPSLCGKPRTRRAIINPVAACRVLFFSDSSVMGMIEFTPQAECQIQRFTTCSKELSIRPVQVADCILNQGTHP